MSISRKNKSMKKSSRSSKRSKNVRKSKKTRKCIKKLRGGGSNFSQFLPNVNKNVLGNLKVNTGIYKKNNDDSFQLLYKIKKIIPNDERIDEKVFNGKSKGRRFIMLIKNPEDPDNINEGEDELDEYETGRGDSLEFVINSTIEHNVDLFYK